MLLPDYADVEIEANAHTPLHCSHHFHIPRGYNSRKLLEIIHREALDQLEPGHNLGVFPFGYHTPINSLK